jgi:hypothetical protein
MNDTPFVVEPEVIRFRYGGWLAITSRATKLRIGVVGESESDARALFDESLRRWKELNKSKRPGNTVLTQTMNAANRRTAAG